MKKLALLLAVIATGCATTPAPPGIERALQLGPTDFLAQAVVGPQGDGAYVVPTTQRIEAAGETVLFPGRPLGLALSPDQSMLAVKNRSDLVFIDIKSHQVVQTLKIADGDNSFRGIYWTSDGATVWTTGSEQWLLRAVRDASGKFAWAKPILLPGARGEGASIPGGFAMDEEKNLAYVALSKNNTVAVVDLATGSVQAQIKVGVAPYDVVLVADKLYVTNWGGRQATDDDLVGPSAGSRVVIDAAGIASTGTVSVIDLASRKVVKEIAVGLHPCAMALAPTLPLLFVANANSDTISVIHLEQDTVVDLWNARPTDDLPFGSAPNALAVSPDGRTLYVANGGNNCIAVMDTAAGSVRGLIPTGWYPGALCLTADNTICVANTKGVGSRMLDTEQGRALLQGRIQDSKVDASFNSHDNLGSVSFVAVPDRAQLEEYTYQTAVNMRLPKMYDVMDMSGVQSASVAVPTKPGEHSPIKHVLYIIKENRTYDQVFGDMKQGNGEPRLCFFGREVTPNHHALAEEFVLLDNLYCNGVLSADGHQWTDEGYVTDYLEKSFGGFPRSYPYDGNDSLAYASSGFIWDHVLAAGLSFRNYGEMVRAVIEPGKANWSDIYNDYTLGSQSVKIRAVPQVRGLENYTCPNYVGFPGKVQDVYRAQEFLKEFRACEAKGEWPSLVMMLLPNDHTVGTRQGYPTPRAAVADNDLALGRIVEAVSNSVFWPETAIFVVEDDPQAGLDHVDGHRTVALCISPYIKRGMVDSTFYNQNSILRTIELILGLAPMNQMNMAANPMTNCFSNTPDLHPYVAKPNEIPLDEMNPQVQATRGKQHYYARKSMEMPLDEVDQADEDTLNRILWHSVKGYDVPYPKLSQRPTIGVAAWPGAKTEDD